MAAAPGLHLRLAVRDHVALDVALHEHHPGLVLHDHRGLTAHHRLGDLHHALPARVHRGAVAAVEHLIVDPEPLLAPAGERPVHANGVRGDRRRLYATDAWLGGSVLDAAAARDEDEGQERGDAGHGQADSKSSATPASRAIAGFSARARERRLTRRVRLTRPRDAMVVTFRSPAMSHWVLRAGEQIFPLSEGRNVVGREVGCDVQIPDHLVSRQHAEIEVEGERVTIRDRHSRNGVVVQGRRLAEGESLALAHGAELVFGRTKLLLLRTRRRQAMSTIEARPVPRGLEGSTGMAMPHETFLREADAASAAGDLAKLEVTVELLFDTLSGALQQGLSRKDPAVRRAIEHGLELAKLSGPRWLERVLGLHTDGGLVMGIDVLTEVERLAARGALPDRAPAIAYVEAIRARLEAQGARGRALLLQLERLARG